MPKLLAALELVRRGFRVFPVLPYDKFPAIKSFQYEATNDPNKVVLWWLERAEANIGVSTTGMVVTDVDTKNGRPGLQSYASVGGTWDTLVVRTPSGGYHAYWNGPDSRSSVDLLPGLDIRSHHGYVLGPGSHTSPVMSGNTDTFEGDYTIVNDAPIRHVPMGIEALLKPPRDRAGRTDSGVELDTAVAIVNAIEWLKIAEVATKAGTGNDMAYKTAAKLVRDYALSEETAYQLMAEHWNPRCYNPRSPDELYGIINHALEYGTGDLGNARPDLIFAGATYVDPVSVMPRKGIYKGNAYAYSALVPRPWIVNNLLMTRNVSLLAGIGAGGKSLSALAMAAHFALGKDFGPYTLKHSGRPLTTIVYNAEDDMMEQSRRLAAVCHQFNFDHDTVRNAMVLICKDHLKLRLVHAERGQVAVLEPAIQYLVNLAKEMNADLTVLDPLISLHNCNENDNGQMGVVMDAIERVAIEGNQAVFVQHHMAKGGAIDRAGNAEAIRGASVITTAPRVSLTITSAGKDDLAKFQIAERERFNFVRIDNAKANYVGRSTEASVWMKWATIKLLNTGDILGIPVPIDMKDRAAGARESLATLLRSIILSEGVGWISISRAVDALRASDSLAEKQHVETTKAQIRNMLGGGVQLGTDRIEIATEKISGRPQNIIKLT